MRRLPHLNLLTRRATDRWRRVEDYFDSRLLGADATLDAVLTANTAAGLPAIDVPAAQGRLLQILATSIGARRILEVGTLGGYSTICLARALPADGSIVTCEIDPRNAAMAVANLTLAGFEHLVDVRVGPAAETLAGLDGPFDMVFIDADKQSNTEYFQHALRLSRPGALIIVDNVVRGGAVVDEANSDPMIQGIRRFTEHIATETRVQATALQTVGAKGHDGFVICTVRDHPAQS